MEPAAAQPSIIATLMPFFFMCIGFSVVAYKLANEKGHNPWLWAILALIPIVNFWCMPYFIGASNSRLEAKIDALLKKNEPLGS